VKTVDRGLACLLILGALLHIMGSWMGYRHAPEMLLWSLAASLATLLVAALNLLRVGRPHDRPLAWVCVGGCLGHIAIALGYGAISGNVLDLRVLINALAAAVLAVFSLRTAVGTMDGTSVAAA
jgi:hypothetical protein